MLFREKDTLCLSAATSVSRGEHSLVVTYIKNTSNTEKSEEGFYWNAKLNIVVAVPVHLLLHACHVATKCVILSMNLQKECCESTYVRVRERSGNKLVGAREVATVRYPSCESHHNTQ